jgi:hypothetical protein
MRCWTIRAGCHATQADPVVRAHNLGRTLVIGPTRWNKFKGTTLPRRVTKRYYDSSSNEKNEM